MLNTFKEIKEYRAKSKRQKNNQLDLKKNKV